MGYKIYPKKRQKEAFKKVMKEGKSVTQAMKEVNYSPATIENPKNLTESKGWQQLVKQYLPDDDLLKVHKQGLKATRIHTSHTEPDKVIPDYATRHKYLETGYKVKGRLLPLTDFSEESPYYEEVIAIIRRAYRIDRRDNKESQGS